MQLLTEIEKFFDMRLPLSVISKASNIRQQAEILKKPDVISFASVIIPIRAYGEKPPLFFFAGKGGNPIRFHSLIKRLPEDRPIYFFRSRGFEEGEKIEITIEEIAADYLKEIKRIQPVGPYHFLGESGGGMVAFEMAQQLLNQDELTHFVIMFDSYLEEIALGKINKFVKNLRLIRKHAQTILSGGIKDYSRYYFELIQYNRKIKAEKIKIKNALGINNNQRDYEKIEKANMLAGAKYIPRPYSGKVVMFSAMRQVQLQGTRADHGWGDVGIEKLIVIPVDCYHGNILFEPFVESISMKINELLVQ
jgi:thioesterase domain-containing protein